MTYSKKVITGVNDLATLFPDIAKEWDYERNNGVLPSEVSPNTYTAYYWICPKGHHYNKKVYLRTHSKSPVHCTKCVKAHSTSFPEQAVYYYAKQFFPDAINRYKGLSDTGLELDIYIPSWNIGIEYDGKAFHSSDEAIKREQHKYEICKQRNIKLIRIKEEKKEDWYNEAADDVYYFKKRPNDSEMDEFLTFFFSQLTLFTHSHVKTYVNPITKKKEINFGLPVDINIRRDRPKILEYLIDVDNSFGNQYPDLAKNWDYDKNGSLTPYMFTPGSNHIVFFKCERCGASWPCAISTVTKWKRTLCKKCSMKDNGVNCTQRIVKQNGSLGDHFEEAVEQWDKTANQGLTPFDIPVNYSKDVFWECPKCGYKWPESPNARVRKDRLAMCPHCAGRVAMPGVDDLETLYPDIAKEWDYERNNGKLPSQFLPHSNVEVYWICPVHKMSYPCIIANRTKGVGCPLCKGDKIRKKRGFRVEQYDKNLVLVAVYDSLNEAARALNTSPEAIRQAVLNGFLSSNYYWKYEGEEFGELKADKKHPVIATNIKTGEVMEFESAREAERQTGVQHSSIMKCCNKKPKYKTAGGYTWEFKK